MNQSLCKTAVGRYKQLNRYLIEDSKNDSQRHTYASLKFSDHRSRPIIMAKFNLVQGIINFIWVCITICVCCKLKYAVHRLNCDEVVVGLP